MNRLASRSIVLSLWLAVGCSSGSGESRTDTLQSELIGDTPTIRAIATGPHTASVPARLPIVGLAEHRDGTSLVLLSFVLDPKIDGVIDPKTDGVIDPKTDSVIDPKIDGAVDLVFSRWLQPGAILVLDRGLRVHELSIAFDASGVPKLTGAPVVHGPFGDPTTSGGGSAIGEVPNAADPKRPFLVIGTESGRVLLRDGLDAHADAAAIDLPVADTTQSPIVEDVAAVPQVGTFALVAVQAGRVVGVIPDSSPSPGLQPALGFDLADPRPDPLADPRPDPIIDIATGLTSDTSSATPLASPALVPIVAVSGTRRVSFFDIPALPAEADRLILAGEARVQTPVVDVETGSLALLAGDGRRILVDPAFKVGDLTLDATRNAWHLARLHLAGPKKR